MLLRFDARVWNLVGGFAWAAAGCGGRVAATDGAETTVADQATESEAGDGDGCVVDEDCNPNYQCIQGMCWFFLDTPAGQACGEDLDCDSYELCMDGYCESQGLPAPACSSGSRYQSIPTTAALALSFVDVDADGQDELVVATEASFEVHEFGGGLPTITPRDPGEIVAMVGGQFDDQQGEDVLVLVGDELRMVPSNGDGSFAAADIGPTPVYQVKGLLAADLAGRGKAPAHA